MLSLLAKSGGIYLIYMSFTHVSKFCLKLLLFLCTGRKVESRAK